MTETGKGAVPPAAGERWTVMTVDDSTFMIRTLSSMLVAMGCEIIATAENGREALETYAALERKPDVITMDITMPEMDGLTALEKILEIDPLQKVVMVSSMGDEETVQKALFLGARHFVVKPPRKEKLAEVMRFVLSR